MTRAAIGVLIALRVLELSQLGTTADCKNAYTCLEQCSVPGRPTDTPRRCDSSSANFYTKIRDVGFAVRLAEIQPNSKLYIALGEKCNITVTTDSENGYHFSDGYKSLTFKNETRPNFFENKVKFAQRSQSMYEIELQGELCAGQQLLRENAEGDTRYAYWQYYAPNAPRVDFVYDQVDRVRNIQVELATPQEYQKARVFDSSRSKDLKDYDEQNASAPTAATTLTLLLALLIAALFAT